MKIFWFVSAKFKKKQHPFTNTNTKHPYLLHVLHTYIGREKGIIMFDLIWNKIIYIAHKRKHNFKFICYLYCQSLDFLFFLTIPFRFLKNFLVCYCLGKIRKLFFSSSIRSFLNLNYLFFVIFFPHIQPQVQSHTFRRENLAHKYA